MDFNKQNRKSYIEIGELFFWTATINNWQNLLLNDSYKQIIINSLTYLSAKQKLDVFAFVIMPNHIHLIWRINEMNGKETTQGSFLKYTAHEFKKLLLSNNDAALNDFAVKAANKKYEFWQRDSLAIHLYSKQVAFQKLDYIHANPLSGKWQLVTDMCDYKYSSAKFYEEGIKEFEFLKDLREEL
jgi:putative transposase